MAASGVPQQPQEGPMVPTTGYPQALATANRLANYVTEVSNLQQQAGAFRQAVGDRIGDIATRISVISQNMSNIQQAGAALTQLVDAINNAGGPSDQQLQDIRNLAGQLNSQQLTQELTQLKDEVNQLAQNVGLDQNQYPNLQGGFKFTKIANSRRAERMRTRKTSTNKKARRSKTKKHRVKKRRGKKNRGKAHRRGKK
jgi:hypothetical protein